MLENYCKHEGYWLVDFVMLRISIIIDFHSKYKLDLSY
jgi:hypothetical protein